MEYLTVFLIVFGVIGLRAFQQKVVNANKYPLMGIIGMCIYAGEGSAILLIAKGTIVHVLFGALGAGLGVMTFVYVYNRIFIPAQMRKDHYR
jgi:hypothetical protein